MKRGSNLPSKETTLETDLPIPPKVSRARDPQKLPSVLRQLREQKKLSQRELARKMGLSRIQLQWMENKPPERLSIREAVLMAGALQYSFPEFMKTIGFKGEDTPKVSRCCIDQPVSSIKFGEGVELSCFLEQPKQAFVGRLILSPQKSFSFERLPRQADYVFAKVTQGTAFVEGCGSPMVLKEKEGFFADFGKHLHQIELQNNHSAQKLSMLLFAHFIANGTHAT